MTNGSDPNGALRVVARCPRYDFTRAIEGERGSAVTSFTGKKREITLVPGEQYTITYNQMVVDELSEADVDRIFQALADATRRDIVERAMQTEQSVSTLAAHYEMSFAAVQKHVAVLERASLITKERRGREQIVHGNVETLRRASRLLGAYEKIWHDRAIRIGDILSEPQKGMDS